MFGTNWSTFVDARVKTKSYSAIFSNSRANNSDSSGQTKSMIALSQTNPGFYMSAGQVI